MTVPERREAPWPFYTQSHAARTLGVPVGFLEGLIGHRSPSISLRAIKSATDHGNWIVLYNRDDIDRAAAIMARRRALR